MSLSKLLLACGLACASLTMAAAVHAEVADTNKPVKAKVVKAKKKAEAKAGPKVEAKAVAKTPDAEADEPTVGDDKVTEFDCELGNKITIYRNETDLEHIALRWKKRLHRLTQVGTTTGAQRFENKMYGLIWIGIPAKGMLLDSKLNRQLANECRDADQARQVGTAAATPDGPGKL